MTQVQHPKQTTQQKSKDVTKRHLADRLQSREADEEIKDALTDRPRSERSEFENEVLDILGEN